ncbi:MAG: insulinase family protein [Phyllobacteriaceae bacterium]|nr:insulinase family protein [Phyllobacteriaceae bacterium]
MDIREVVSPKGVKAWLVEDHGLPIITLRFAFRGGSTQDPAGKEGLAKLMAGLFDEGAGDLDSDAFQIKMDSIGAEMSFDAGRDALYGNLRLLSESREEALGLLALALDKTRYDEKPVERIRAQLLAGIEASANDPETKAGDVWRAALYADHPYARRDDGTADSLKAIAIDDLRAAKARLLGRDNLVVAVVGDIDEATLAVELDRVFGGLPERAGLAPVTEIEPKLDQRIPVVEASLPQTTLQFAWPGVDRDAPEFFAAYVMNHIYGGGTFSSRLYMEVREKRGLAYGVGSGLVDQDWSKMLFVQTATRADRAAETIAIVLEEAAKIARDGVTAAELKAAKANIIGSYAINNLSSSKAIARTLADLQLIGLPRDYIDKRAAFIDAVTADEVKAVAAKLFSARPAIMALGPDGAFAELK